MEEWERGGSRRVRKLGGNGQPGYSGHVSTSLLFLGVGGLVTGGFEQRSDRSCFCFNQFALLKNKEEWK